MWSFSDQLSAMRAGQSLNDPGLLDSYQGSEYLKAQNAYDSAIADAALDVGAGAGVRNTIDTGLSALFGF